MMMKKALAIASTAILTMVVAFAATRPDIPQKPPEMLKKAATHIAIGEVLRVYEVQEKEPKWKYTRYVAELRIESLEKGKGVAAGELLFVRWFKRSYRRGTPPPSSNGFTGWTPQQGDRVRAYIAHNAHDGYHGTIMNDAYNVLVPNGFEKLTP